MDKQEPFDLNIYPIRPNQQKNPMKKKIHPNLMNIENGCLCLCVAPVRSGKSSLISNLLLSKNFYKDAFDYVVIISNTAFNDDTSRFLVDKYKGSVYDRYDDKIIQDIITYQESFTDKRDQKRFALILDDFIGIKSSSLIWKLCSRYRHYNCGMLFMASQNFKSLPPIARNNASHYLLGNITNMKEMEKLSSELSDSFGGDKSFRSLMNEVHGTEKYQWAYADLTHNPPKLYKNFDNLLYQGGKKGSYLEIDEDNNINNKNKMKRQKDENNESSCE